VTEDRFGQLLGPYLLGELSDEEEHELERHLEQCNGCRHELDRVRQMHDLLRQMAAKVPPPELKTRVLARARGQILARPWDRWGFWVPTAAALLIAAVLGVGLFRTITGDSSVAVPLTATSLAPGAGGEVQAEEVGENLRVKLEVWGMPELADDEYYEMWYYAEDGGRISCGTFRVGSESRTTVNLTAPATAREYPEIEITREPDDGNPGVSGEEVLEGKLQSS
jgi:anti-sigma-K factor RskA